MNERTSSWLCHELGQRAAQIKHTHRDRFSRKWHLVTHTVAVFRTLGCV